jgi:hypothetical protein
MQSAKLVYTASSFIAETATAMVRINAETGTVFLYNTTKYTFIVEEPLAFLFLIKAFNFPKLNVSAM